MIHKFIRKSTQTPGVVPLALPRENFEARRVVVLLQPLSIEYSIQIPCREFNPFLEGEAVKHQPSPYHSLLEASL